MVKEALAALRHSFVIDTSDEATLRHEAQSLRHRVFCLERGIFSADTDQKLEVDRFDSRARHVVLRRRHSGEAVGTVRLVLPCAESPHGSLPMHQYCNPAVLGQAPLLTTAEISRLAISKQRRVFDCPSDTVLKLGLIRGILSLSAELKITHWCALMTPALSRLLNRTGICFEPKGPLVQAHGARQPSLACIEAALSEGELICPDAYQYVSVAGLGDADGCRSGALATAA